VKFIVYEVVQQQLLISYIKASVFRKCITYNYLRIFSKTSLFIESFHIFRPTLNIYLIIILLLKMLRSHTLCLYIFALAYLICKTENIVFLSNILN